MRDGESLLLRLRTVLGWLPSRRRRQFKALLLLSFAGAFAELAALGALLPFLAILADSSKIGADTIAGQILSHLGWFGEYNRVTRLTCLFGVVVLIAAAVRVSLTWASARFAREVGLDISARVYDRVLYQPYSYHVVRNSSEVLSSIEKTDALVREMFTPAVELLTSVLMALAIITGLLVIDARVALLAVGLFGGPYLVISTLSARLLRHESGVLAKAGAARLKAMQEGLGGIRDVLLYGGQDLQLKRFCDATGEFRRSTARVLVIAQLPRAVMEALGTVIIAGIAAYTVMKAGSLSNALPVLGALALGAQRLLPLFQRVYASWSQLNGSVGTFREVAAIAELPIHHGLRAVPNPARLPFKKVMALRSVGFRYAPESPWILRGVDLEIPRGSRVGFMGRTGSGKSTLLDLLMGLISPTEGYIEVDGEPLTPQNLRNWQARIAHVPQDIFLADASVAANIAFGAHSGALDLERLAIVSRQALLHDFVVSLPEGYGTMVGERGVRLSGGQRQRIGIARALYRNAEVLVLDEATSALDNQTQSTLMDGLRDISGNVTVLIVAHRLSTLESCDFVVDVEMIANRFQSE